MSERSLRAIWISNARAFVLLVLLTHSAIAFATSYQWPTPDPWYQVSIRFDESLPPGVSFEPVTNCEKGGFAGYFTNSSKVPFYLITAPDNPPMWIEDLPTNVVPAIMAVSGSWFYMAKQGVWQKMRGKGFHIASFFRIPTEYSGKIKFEMEAYLGSQKITIAGRYIRAWKEFAPGAWTAETELELNSPLPQPLRIGEDQIINDGPVPLYGPLDITFESDPKIRLNPTYLGIEFPEPISWLSELPSGYMASRKIVSGKSYFAVWTRRSHYDETGSSSVDGWVEEPKRRQQRPMVSDQNLEDYFPGFSFEQVFLDDRPDDVEVPDPVLFELTTVYGKSSRILRGKILYSLNLEYDPQAGSRPPTCLSCMGEMCDECFRPDRPIFQWFKDILNTFLPFI